MDASKSRSTNNSSDVRTNKNATNSRGASKKVARTPETARAPIKVLAPSTAESQPQQVHNQQQIR